MSEFSLITHALPTEIEVEEKAYRLDTRTCKALQAFLFSDDDSIPIEVRMYDAISKLIVGAVEPKHYPAVYEKLAEYLEGYPTESSREKHKPILSTTQDHALIVAAFQQAYGISLDELKSMHWWRFLALLSGLPESTRMAEVMKVRAMPISGKDSPEQRQAKIKAKNAVAIKPKKKANQTGFDIISQALDAE